ncbi:hypothetical protein HK100_012870 [Physocladia obscura]|uniref:Methyltransferase domain-containing protein n=1 Tax=Physocladia obscura TaxID=109957 RepID=A0AAD5T834_9FUNG|nr:hypothetical protein HK100_012870 [Physocladia obscura]
MGSQVSRQRKLTTEAKPRQPAPPTNQESPTTSKEDISKNDSVAQSPKSQPSMNRKLNPAQIDALQAKQWNPNNPASWEPDMRNYHALPNSDYVLPNDVDEQNRLEMQHYVMRAYFEGDIVCPQAKELVKIPGTKVLDVGCANGFWLRCVKKEFPLAEYHGTDISQALIDESREKNDGITWNFGNVLETLPYEDNTFDFVHQRFLVLGMPREKFADALKELIRVTKPGGWIELFEGDVVLATALFDGLHNRGLDCYAATNLPYYTKKVAVNVENQEIKSLQIPLSWGSNMGVLFGADARATMLGMEDWLHKAMGITRDEYRELIQNCYAEWAGNHAFMHIRALNFQVKK